MIKIYPKGLCPFLAELPYLKGRGHCGKHKPGKLYATCPEVWRHDLLYKPQDLCTSICGWTPGGQRSVYSRNSTFEVAIESGLFAESRSGYEYSSQYICLIKLGI